MRLNGLMQPLKENEEFKTLINNINSNKFPVGIYGVSESAKSYMINGIYNEFDKSILVFTHDDVEAKDIYEDLSFYTNDVHYFPTKEVVFYNLDAISGDLLWERLKVIREIAKDSNKIIVTSIENLAASYLPIELYNKYTIELNVGDTLNLEKLSEKLIQSGYERVDMIYNKGQFSIRGGILDVYSPISVIPYRIELFGDEIDSIRSFNIESQRSIDKVSKIELFPAKEIILTKEIIDKGVQLIKKDLNVAFNNLKGKKNKEARERIENTINNNLELLMQTRSFETIDSFINYFYEDISNFIEIMGNCLVIVDDVQRCKNKLDNIYFEFEESYNASLKRGEVLPSQANLLIDRDIVFNTLENSNVIILESMLKSSNFIAPKSITSFSQIDLYNYQGQFDLLADDILDKKSKGFKIVILCATRSRGERLVKILKDKGIECTYKDVISKIENSEVVVTFGNQNKSFEYSDLKLCIISDKKTFGQPKLKANKKKSNKGLKKIKSFTELKVGDYIVHTNHGIAVYKGVKQLEVEGYKKDYLVLNYKGGDVLYVPVDQLDMVQKYIGKEGKAPKLNKLGGTEWNKTKNKVRKSINEIAKDLIKLYAIRSTVKGHIFSKDTIWQKQFEDEFSFEETPDQIIALEDIKKDMESDKPMDRLLCGDVGYGKTEVAMRVAFKAVMDGKQVAFLVPTTILANQHYNNFIQRFEDFPIKVDMISRFRSSSEQKNTIQLLKEGNIDIIIGTHRMLQNDIKFKDLGLLIIDEEQRFGVTHKEKIKNIKKNVDVLTLTATPIPRTLHMSLVGVRDISVIETPPEERYPVQTYVVQYNDQLIRDAILKEINREGQVFFIYNRVETIDKMSEYLSKLVPEGKIAVAHGQMTERQLESVMMDFIKNKYNILVCTTIIETGIDIQNANTLIIYDADKMGLSQLYQLRGRVGRSNRIAYAYFTYRKDKVLTEVAEKRLDAIKGFTELGSGFKIALRDLEIRGAGNMMGSAQHGHMAAVGYDLYCKMLEDTIKVIKGEVKEEPVETVIEIKVDAYIPGDYIEDEMQKIEIYKKIAAIDSKDDIIDVEEEIEDRFSDIPLPVYNLIDISYMRSIGSQIGIIKIKEENQEVLIEFDNKDKINERFIKCIIDKYSKKLKFKFGDKPVIAYKLKDVKRKYLLKELIEVIEYMKTIVETN